jgi:hypothetical protein
LEASKKKANKPLAMLLAAVVCVVVTISVLTTVLSKNGVSRTGLILVNEIMASNKSQVIDDTGQYADWIELYNPGSGAVSLSGWGLSDQKAVPAKWVFPDLTMQPGSYLLVFCDKLDHRDPAAPLHANFGLSNSGEDVLLTDNLGTVVDYVSFKTMAGDTSYGRDPANANNWISFTAPTPGFPNTDAGRTAYLATQKASASDLLITEVMSNNFDTLLDDYGAASDWVEIFNNGKSAVNLSGYGLSDNPDKLLKWTFPGVTLQPGAYLVVFCSGKGQAKDPADTTHLHTNFALSSYNSTVLLSSVRGQMLVSVNIPQLAQDTSYVYDPNARTWRTTTKPTPGYPNTDAGYQQWQNSIYKP